MSHASIKSIKVDARYCSSHQQATLDFEAPSDGKKQFSAFPAAMPSQQEPMSQAEFFAARHSVPMEPTSFQREAESCFHQLAEHISEVFWMVDPRKGTVLYVSPAYERIWGRSCQSFYELPYPDALLQAVYPDDRPRVLSYLERQRQDQSTAEEFRMVRPDGTIRWVWDRAFLARDQAGQVRRLVGITEDITERKHAEQALQEAERHKDEFLAMLAHELRNPLAPLRNAFLIMRLRSVSASVQEQTREMGERQVLFMSRIIDELLDLSRIRLGKIQLRKEVVDLEKIVATAVETARPLLEASKHDFAVTLPAEPVQLEADATRLEQVICNLLNNAAKYTKPEGCIRLTAERNGSEVLIRVQDNGTGLAPEMLPRVFDLFTQAETSRDRSQGGLGIGLSLVKQLTEMHGGTVEAFSGGLGKGSEFVIRLPILQESSRDEADENHWRAGYVGRTRRVLVVDDNVDAAASLGMILSIWRHEVHIVHDGPAALQAFQQFQPEVVLLDIGLPGMSGHEVARQLRAQSGTQKLLIAALTGYGLDQDRRLSQEAGFDVHLVKPAPLDVLEKLLGSFGVVGTET